MSQINVHGGVRSVGSDIYNIFIAQKFLPTKVSRQCEKIVCETAECGLQSFHQIIIKINVYELIL